MDAFNFVNQVPTLSASDEEIMPMSDEDLIKQLGLTVNAEDNNAGIRMDNLIIDLDLDIFSTTTGVPTAPSQGQFLCGNFQGAHQPSEIISYIDLEPSENENTQYHLSGGYMINNEVNILPTTVQEVSSPAPPTLVEHQDTRQAAGGKTKGRKRESNVKLYQRKEPLSSQEEEKRRQNAINAKINQDKKEE